MASGDRKEVLLNEDDRSGVYFAERYLNQLQFAVIITRTLFSWMSPKLLIQSDAINLIQSSIKFCEGNFLKVMP